uniref:Uncharacterized protein n=1 Tax=Myoviridae sp. ctWaE18 TaxID=2826662 RepID=A0A8S5MXJ3_9CAUD|nr:MAG TPA: hypothetical protein [Myoviridae sp. ctWaE18]
MAGAENRIPPEARHVRRMERRGSARSGFARRA